MAYRKRSTAEKKRYGAQFSEDERRSYRKGKRYGFLIGVHAPRKKK